MKSYYHPIPADKSRYSTANTWINSAHVVSVSSSVEPDEKGLYYTTWEMLNGDCHQTVFKSEDSAGDEMMNFLDEVDIWQP